MSVASKILLGIAVILAILFIPVFGCVAGYIGKAATVTMEQIDPSRLLREYENFKDMHASLSAKKSGIEVLQSKIDALEADYQGVARKEWPRDDRQALNQYRSERTGMVLMFNDLARQYNANMAKINYRFTNVGDLPAGAIEPLPREYVLYLNH